MKLKHGETAYPYPICVSHEKAISQMKVEQVWLLRVVAIVAGLNFAGIHVFDPLYLTSLLHVFGW